MPIGASITDVGNTARNKTGGWRTFKPEIEKEKCIKCGNCWIYCPDGCVSNKDGYEIELDYCKGCGICANECPTGAIEMILEEK